MSLATLKNYQQELQLFHGRIVIAFIAIVLSALILSGRLIYLQIFQHHTYKTLSQQNQLDLLPIAPKRGLIFDRHHVLVAENIPVYNLEIIPQFSKNLHSSLQRLQQIMPLSADELKQFYKTLKQTRRFRPVPLKFHLSAQQVARFAVNRYAFPGVRIAARLIRYYPLGPVMAPVLGYVGRINSRELQHLDRNNYADSNYIGKIGLEKYAEPALHGQTGNEQVEIDASGRIVRTIKQTKATPGQNLQLTIDSHLQQVAYHALGDSSGAIVAIDPQTGGILALVSKPSYDPNLFVQGIDQKSFQALQTSDDKPLYNRAIRGQYPIASAIKPFISLIGLASGVIDPQAKIHDPGFFQLPHTKRIYHDWAPYGHGEVDLEKALIVSCDTFFFHWAIPLGIHRIDSILQQFGFGHLTGVELHEEAKGLVASPAWKKHHLGENWYAGDTINAVIGQGYMLTTPIQLANATAALATHGRRYRPHLIAHTTATRAPLASPAYQIPSINMPASAWQIVEDAMIDVINDRHGTGFRFGRHTPYIAAGKTGTGQVYSKDKLRIDPRNLPKKLRDNSSFIVYAPVKQPKIAVAVIVEHSPLAPTIARQVIDAYLLPPKKTRPSFDKTAAPTHRQNPQPTR